MTGLTQSAFAGRFGGTQSLQNRLFLAGLGHIRGRDRPKRGDLGGACTAPEPPPRKSCKLSDESSIHEQKGATGSRSSRAAARHSHALAGIFRLWSFVFRHYKELAVQIQLYDTTLRDG